MKIQKNQVTKEMVEEKMDEFERLVTQVANDCLPGFRIPEEILWKYRTALDEYSRGNFKWSIMTMDEAFGHLRATVRKYISCAVERRFVPMVAHLRENGIDQDLVSMANKPINQMNDWVRQSGLHFDISTGVEMYTKTLSRIKEAEFEWERRSFNRENKKREEEILQSKQAQEAHERMLVEEREAEADRRQEQLDRILGRVSPELVTVPA